MEAFVEEYFDQNPISQVRYNYGTIHFCPFWYNKNVPHLKNKVCMWMSEWLLSAIRLGGSDHNEEQKSREADGACRCEKKM